MDNPLNYLKTMKSFLKAKKTEANSSDLGEKVYTKDEFFVQCDVFVDSLISLLNVCPFVLEAKRLEGDSIMVEGVECEYTELENIYLFKPKHDVSDSEYAGLHEAINRLVDSNALKAKFVFVLSYDFDVFTTKIKDETKEGN